MPRKTNTTPMSWRRHQPTRIKSSRLHRLHRCVRMAQPSLHGHMFDVSPPKSSACGLFGGRLSCLSDDAVQFAWRLFYVWTIETCMRYVHFPSSPPARMSIALIRFVFVVPWSSDECRANRFSTTRQTTDSAAIRASGNPALMRFESLLSQHKTQLRTQCYPNATGRRVTPVRTAGGNVVLQCCARTHNRKVFTISCVRVCLLGNCYRLG